MNPQKISQTDQDTHRPVYYDANGQPVYEPSRSGGGDDAVSTQSSAAPGEVAPAGKANQSKVYGVQQESQPAQSSHVNRAPESHDGHSFDPRIRAQYSNEPGVVHATRNIDMEKREVSSELQQRHEESKKHYPHLNLTEGEVVILSLRRHPIGLFIPLGAGGTVLLALVVVLIMYPADSSGLGLPSFGVFALIASLLMILIGIGTYIAVWVYLKNQFFMTNESVIQEIQHSLFSKREQTVSLGSIEDASYRQSGILPTMLNYGTIRLSTEGEETTYRFQYVENPREQVAILNNGVEAFKNGRPVELKGHDN